MVFTQGTKNLLSPVFIFLATIVFLSCGGNSPKDFYYSGNYPPVKTITVTENGRDYDMEAVSGQVMVFFQPTVSHAQAVQYIKKMKGMIIGQAVDIHFYLVYAENESAFLDKIKNHSGLRFAGLNAVEYPCAVAPKTSVIDNFYIPHGDNVAYALQECGLTTKIDKYNVGMENDESGRMLWSEIIIDLESVLKNAPRNTPLVINMSFGPGFTDPGIDYWTDENISDDVKNNYKKHYKDGLKSLAAVVENYREKDFVIVKAAGNEGLKNLDLEILNDLGRELSAAEFNALNTHVILAGAEDNRNQEYSNTVSSGNYNFLYTAVDISDLKYKNEHLYGTSFAAPRISCFISSAVNEYNIKATDALKAVKDITYRNPGQPLARNDLEREAKIIAAAKKVESAENSGTPSQTVISNNGRKNTEGGQLPDASAKNIGGTVSSQTWEETDFWGTDYYTVITKSQFDNIIKDSEKKFRYIGIDYTSPYLGTLPRSKLNLKEPYCLLHTWDRPIYESGTPGKAGGLNGEPLKAVDSGTA